jgi:hypothetical protein
MNEGRIEIRGPGGIEEQAGMPVSRQEGLAGKMPTHLGAIQELLGHEDPASRCYAGTSMETTEIYLHVVIGEHGLGVVSPLDRLVGC